MASKLIFFCSQKFYSKFETCLFLSCSDVRDSIIDFIWGEGQYLLSCNHLIHIRHELTNTKGHEELCSWLEKKRIHFLSINDHLPPFEYRYKWMRHISSLRQRITLSNQEIIDMLTQLQEHRQEGSLQVEHLVELAHI